MALGLFPGGALHSQDFEAPSIGEFFPKPFLFQGTPFEMNRIVLVRLIVVAFFIVVAILYRRRSKLIPGRAQSLFESILDFCRENVSEAVLGKTIGRRFNGIITTIFMTVLLFNMAGLVPGLNIAGTAVAGVPLLLALTSTLLFIAVGIKYNGGLKYFKATLFPSGVPKVLYLLLTPIEFISTFLMRPFTLFVRLLANMISGHILLGLALLATNYFILLMSAWSVFSIVTFLAAILFTCFELLVAGLQAYIFAMLTAVYLDLSVHAEH